MMKVSKIRITAAIVSVAAATGCLRKEADRIDRKQAFEVGAATRVGWVDTIEHYTPEDSEPMATDSTMSVIPYGTAVTKSEDRPVSKMTDAGFQEGDVIAVYIHEQTSLQAEDNHSNNMSYVLQGGKWYATAALGDALTKPKYYASAYSPHQSGVTNTTKIAHRVSLDQSAPAGKTAGGLEQSDFAFTLKPVEIQGIDGATPSAVFEFNHIMSKLQIDIEVPAVVDGENIASVEEVWVTNTATACDINLIGRTVNPTGAKTSKIKMRHKSGDRLPGKFSSFEAIVVPQTVTKGTQLVEVKLLSVIGTEKLMAYIVPSTADQVFNREEQVTLTLRSMDNLRFASELDFLDGLKKTSVPLKIVAPKGSPWTLNSAQTWCRLSLTPVGGYGLSIAGTGTGAEQTVYVDVPDNIKTDLSAAYSRTSVLTLSAKVGIHTPSVTYSAVQNFHTFQGPTGTGNETSNKHATQVPTFINNQTWYATSADTWLKLASSSVWGSGTPGARYPMTGGAAGAATAMWMQLEPNPTKSTRTTTITYYSYYDVMSAEKTKTTRTITQAASNLTGTAATVSTAGSDVASTTHLTFTTSVGLPWTVGNGPAWVKSYTPASGEVAGTGGVTNATSVTVTTGEANNTNSARTASATITAGNMTLPLNITQAAPVLTIPTVAETVNPQITRSTCSVAIPAYHKGVTWTPSATITSGMAPTITPSTLQTVPDNTAYTAPVVVDYTANNGAQRTITARATYGTSLYQNYLITQNYAQFSINPTTINVSADATEANGTTVTYNVDWTATSASPSGGVFTGTTSGTAQRNGLSTSPAVTGVWTFPAQPATPSVARTHSVTYTPTIPYSSYSATRTFNVVQAARQPYISVGSYGSWLAYTGGSYTTNISSNTYWQIYSTNGATASPSSGFGNATVTINTTGSNGSIYEVGRSVQFYTYNHPGLSNSYATSSFTQADNPYVRLFFGKIRLAGASDITLGIRCYSGNSSMGVNIFTQGGSWSNPTYGLGWEGRINLGGGDGNLSTIYVYDRRGVTVSSRSGCMGNRGWYTYSNGSWSYSYQSEISE